MSAFGPGAAGSNVALNITAATVLKATPGVLISVSVIVAGSAVGGVFDTTTTTPANQFGVVPIAVTTEPLVYEWRCLNGIMIVPPTGGTVAVLFV